MGGAGVEVGGDCGVLLAAAAWLPYQAHRVGVGVGVGVGGGAFLCVCVRVRACGCDWEGRRGRDL